MTKFWKLIEKFSFSSIADCLVSIYTSKTFTCKTQSENAHNFHNTVYRKLLLVLLLLLRNSAMLFQCIRFGWWRWQWQWRCFVNCGCWWIYIACGAGTCIYARCVFTCDGCYTCYLFFFLLFVFPLRIQTIISKEWLGKCFEKAYASNAHVHLFEISINMIVCACTFQFRWMEYK